MLKNFFQLNGSAKAVKSQEQFIGLLNTGSVSNLIYYPNEFGKASGQPQRKIKLESRTFDNISFKDTVILNVEFTNCHFNDCLFLGSTFKNCKLISCTFKGCNTLGISIINSYMNPDFFKKNYRARDYQKANIAVQLFQELYNNSIKLENIEFKRKSRYLLLLWEDKLLFSKWRFKKPYPLKFWDFIWDFLINSLFRFGFGYGLRLRNYLYSFVVLFISCFYVNKVLWNGYALKEKDLSIEYFSPINYSNYANFHYTTDVLTKVIDSQFQPSSNMGMIWYSVQGGLGLIFFSLLITVLINRFVK